SYSIAAFRCALLGIERLIVFSREIADEIGVNATSGQRVGVAFVGTRIEFYAAIAVQDEYSRALSYTICRVSSHRDTALGSVHIEFFGKSRMRRRGNSKRCNAGENDPPTQRLHQHPTLHVIQHTDRNLLSWRIPGIRSTVSAFASMAGRNA